MISTTTSKPALVQAADGSSARVYVWDVVVRATHWLIVLSFVTLSITGYYIGKPFVDPRAGVDVFIMARFKLAHFYSAIVFTSAVFARLIWLFSGTKYARWDQFIPVTKARWQNIRQAFLFYVFVHRCPPEYPGHNGLAGLAYLLVFGLYVLAILTGLSLYSVDASVTSYTHGFRWLLPLFGGAASARWIHHIIMWLLFGFTVHHVFAALLMSQTERDGTIDSIFSGFKFVRETRELPNTKQPGGADAG